MLSESPIRALDGCEPCNWETNCSPGHSAFSVSMCRYCGRVDWDELQRQGDAYARQYAARMLEEVYGFFERSDGSRGIAWKDGRANTVAVQEIHDLFSKQPEGRKS